MRFRWNGSGLTKEAVKTTVLAGERKKSGRNIRLRPEAAELLLDLLACLLLGSGLAGGVLVYLGLETSSGQLLALGLGGVAVLAFWRLRWWVGPLFAALGAGGAALALWRLKRLEEWLAAFAGFGAWVGQGMPQDSLFAQGGWGLLARFGLLLAVLAPVFFLLRRWFVFPLLPVAVGGVYLPLPLLEYELPVVGLCLCLSGLVLLLPRFYYRLAGKGRLGAQGVTRGAMQWIALPAALVLVLLAGLTLPQDTTGWQSRGLVNLTGDLRNLLRGPLSAPQGNGPNFSMASTGFMPLGERLGGPVERSNERVLTLRGENPPVRLKGAVQDVYTGTAWRDGWVNGDFRWDSLFWRGYRSEAFDLDRPLGGRAARSLYQQVWREQTYQLTYATRRQATVFTGGKLRALRLPDPRYREAQLWFNMQSEVYLHELLPTGMVVEVTCRVAQKGEGARQALLALEAAAGEKQDKRLAPYLERYTQLPEDLPAVVWETAAEITGQAGAGTPYERALALEAWLAEQMTYTLEPEIPPEGEDFVAHFLRTREGYCTYYATAMAVLARCQGLPARYVTGYALVRLPGDEGLYEATGETAHAWVEIYLAGVGWIEFDPLDWDPATELPPWEEEEAAAPEEPEPPAVLVEEPEEPQQEGAAVETGPEELEEEGDSRGRAVMLLVLAIVALALVRIGRKLVWRLPRWRCRWERACRRFPDTRERLEFYYRDILRLLALFGVEPEPGETHGRFAGRVDKRLLQGGGMSRTCETYTRCLFGGEQPGEGELREVFAYHQALEDHAWLHLGRAAYFTRRVLGL